MSTGLIPYDLASVMRIFQRYGITWQFTDSAASRAHHEHDVLLGVIAVYGQDIERLSSEARRLLARASDSGLDGLSEAVGRDGLLVGSERERLLHWIAQARLVLSATTPRQRAPSADACVPRPTPIPNVSHQIAA